MWKWITIAIAVALVGAMFLSAVPLKTVAYEVNVPYETTEIYYEKEPFNRVETYTEKEPYNQSLPVQYVVVEAIWSNWFFSAGSDLWVTIRNADTQSGYFSVTFDITLKGGATKMQTESAYIAIAEQKQILTKYSGAYVESYKYTITPPTKTVTSFRDVQKKRTVTDYRDVQKQRTVTKVRIETRYKKVPILSLASP